MNSKFCLSREAWKVEFHSKKGGNTGRDTVTVDKDEEVMRSLGQKNYANTNKR